MQPLSPEEAERLDGLESGLASTALSFARRGALAGLVVQALLGGAAFGAFPATDAACAGMTGEGLGTFLALRGALVVALVVSGPLSAFALAARADRPSILATLGHALVRLPVVGALILGTAFLGVLAYEALERSLSSAPGVALLLMFGLDAVAFAAVLVLPPLVVAYVFAGIPSWRLVRALAGGDSPLVTILGLGAIVAILVPKVFNRKMPFALDPWVEEPVFWTLLVVIGEAWLLALAAAHHRTEKTL